VTSCCILNGFPETNGCPSTIKKSPLVGLFFRPAAALILGVKARKTVNGR